MEEKYRQALLRAHQNVPRYTSYPPANFFGDQVGGRAYRAALSALPSGQDVSLYLHIPFCPKMCWFCGCHTQAIRRYEPVAHYLDLLRQEMRLVAAALPRDVRVTHLHFGGGSPTMLSASDFTDLMTDLRSFFPVAKNAAIAVEIDPRQITPEKMAAYAQAGVTRISMGVQDIHDHVMRAINRVQPLSMIERAFKMCRDVGIHHINVDLIYGLPHQSIASIEETARAICALSPTRLALFGYAHVPWMKKHMRLISSTDLPDARARLDLCEASTGMILDAGYMPVGIDHFAQPKDSLALAAQNRTLRRNFQGYVPADENVPIIGLGVSAISQFPGLYAQNTPHTPHYRDALEAGIPPIIRGHILSAEDIARGTLIEQLMCQGQVTLPAPFMTPEWQIAIHPLLADGLAIFDKQTRLLTVPHRLGIRLVAATLDSYRVASTDTQRHAAAI